MIEDSMGMVWLVAGLFYIPIHFGIPAMLVFYFTLDCSELRAGKLKWMILESTVSLVLAFLIAIWLWEKMLGLTIAALVLSSIIPIAHILLTKNKYCKDLKV